MGGRSSGLGWGGPRAGAGRKPRQPKVATAMSPLVGPVPVGSGVVRPAMPEDVAAVWDALAPQAMEKGTLEPGTVYAFAELCRLAVWQRKVAAELEAQGLTDAGMRVGKVYLAATQQLDLKMKAFRIAPDGKPIVAVEQPKPQSALEKLKAQSRGLRLA